MNINYKIAYGEENITINKDNISIVLNKEEQSFLLTSLLNHLKIDITIK